MLTEREQRLKQDLSNFQFFLQQLLYFLPLTQTENGFSHMTIIHSLIENLIKTIYDEIQALNIYFILKDLNEN